MPYKDPEKRRAYCRANGRKWYAKNKERRAKVGHEYYERNKAKRNAVTAQRRREYRRKALSMYGGVCQCCGEGRYEFLSFDHINGGGSAHRKTFTTVNFIHWLLKEKREGIQVLCHNCNQAKGAYGCCPHERERAS
jgi:hypothetical protein